MTAIFKENSDFSIFHIFNYPRWEHSMVYRRVASFTLSSCVVSMIALHGLIPLTYYGATIYMEPSFR